MSEPRKTSHAANTTKKGKSKAANARKSSRKSRYSKRVRIAVTAAASLMAVVAVLFIGGGAYVWNLLNKIGTGIDSPNSYETSLPDGEGGRIDSRLCV